MSRRIVTRKLLLCSVVTVLLILCIVIFAELSFVRNLEPRDRGDADGIGGIGRVINRVPCPELSPELNDIPRTRLGRGMDEIYKTLKRRKRGELLMEKSIKELWWYLRKHLKNDNSNLNTTLRSIKNQYISLRWKYETLDNVYLSPSEPFQLNWNYWQRNISLELTSIMKKRIQYLQHPPNCEIARKLVCRVAKSCGFGCQIHHVSFCFIMAYATKRTLILDSTNWRYSPSGWDAIFEPISSTCTEIPSDTREFSMTSQAQSLYLPPIDSLNPRPEQLPMAIPNDLANRLMSFHGLPFVWFIAQFLQYLMRPSNELRDYLHQKRLALGMGSKDTEPIVGLHVRRTDKKAEARYHNIEEYMIHVEEWFEGYQLTHSLLSIQRRIYIATDEPGVIAEAKSRYPSYQIFSDSEISSMASKVNTRYSANSLFGLLFDVTTLSQCNYIVCTFSSQVCRLAYELMQNYHVDGSQNYFSLDDIYYFGGQQAHDVIAIEKHKSSDHSEISFEIGDHLGIAGNEKNGYSVGVNRRTQIRGEYPSYKVEEYVQTEEFPTYKEVTL